jgi:uncharacterized protein YggE
VQLAKPTLRVQGHGRIATAPDVVVLSLAITSEDRDYSKTIEGLNTRLEALRRSVTEAEEDTKALRTTSFTVSIKNDYVKDRYLFRGFCGDHQLELRLAFDQSRLARVFSAISASQAKPRLSIAFTVSDPEAIRHRVLENAVKNAHRRAEVIAAASGQKLGAIVAIDHGYSEIRVSSDQYLLDSPAASGGAPEIEPSEIESTDTVQIAWEITHDTTTEA